MSGSFSSTSEKKIIGNSQRYNQLLKHYDFKIFQKNARYSVRFSGIMDVSESEMVPGAHLPLVNS